MHDAQIRQVVGGGAYARGLEYARRGMVISSTWSADGRMLTGIVRGSGRSPYRVFVELAASGNVIDTSCTCPVGDYCKHVAALLLSDAEHGVTSQPAWELQLAGALGSPLAIKPAPDLGMELEVLLDDYAEKPVRLRARPVYRAASGKWARKVSWEMLTRGYAEHYDARQVAALAAVHRLTGSTSGYYSPSSAWIWLDTAGSGLWTALTDARRAGVAVLAAGTDTDVTLHDEQAHASLDLHAGSDGAIEGRPLVVLDGRALTEYTLLGEPDATGIFWWDGDGPRASPLHLARFDTALSSGAAALVGPGHPLLVPADDAPRFLHRYYPRLTALLEVTSRDGSVDAPALPTPTLVLTLDPGPEHAVTSRWTWEYRSDDGRVVEQRGVRDLRLDPQAYRAPADEARIQSAAAQVAGLLVDNAGNLLDRTVGGWQTVDLVADVLPALRELPDVEVRVDGELPDYREAEHEPQVTVTPGPSTDRTDWFDLAVTVEVDGRDVMIATLVAALAAGQTRLLLPDGLWVRIDTPALEALRALIEESRGLADRRGIGVGRLQVNAWDELEALGVVVTQADEWRRAVSEVRLLEEPPQNGDVPAAVGAELRPYQRAGYAWLAHLHGSGLGGILADDMGLGKTLQVLTLAARVHALDTRTAREQPPLLVVAPTSVVGAWAGEAAKFVPGLRVVTIDRTAAKRGTALADLAADADVVVTSYALFRIEHDDYTALPWSVLVLDEAQTVKNHTSRTYACARTLDVPMKLAITGTPLENTVMELWAILGIVAPGLLPPLQKFTEQYRYPIERNHDASRLAQLRRRIRPLVLRRTKESVADDLPPRIEQVVDIDLAPAHRVVYDRHLQRERQKVLGLLAEMEGNRFEIFRSLTLLRRLALDPSLVDPDHARVPASKLDVLETMLDEIVTDGHRVLVFSQFTGVLDRVRTRLDGRSVAYSYLDGTTTRRAAVIDDFRTGTNPVFLISLKAGGVGLTLTEADYVIVLDPWWNPAVEAQAVDRAHRIGQKKNVMVYRLVATGTIEEKVMALKASKSRLFDAIMGGGELSNARLTADDIRALLGAEPA
ncbi:DEAD/DEAH box helicase [Cellulomonas sp. JH27-2]|uniref:DEAD/DEAH box helicase n=1 Tax=Cellulomonas sp. JH27-2 TaxID=2774139 RepID=UPI0017872A15|nr:DEAD/DEAH box helicase [Cellulomonas sp. JH27-2]MBD8057677.1 DEAD/DEAH box helicase [Cellulomonas sp. JH27-2]